MSVTIIIAVVFSFFDFTKVHGFIFYSASALVVLYVGRISVLTILENSKKYRKFVPLGYAIVTYSVLFIFNFLQ